MEEEVEALCGHQNPVPLLLEPYITLLHLSLVFILQFPRHESTASFAEDYRGIPHA